MFHTSSWMPSTGNPTGEKRPTISSENASNNHYRVTLGSLMEIIIRYETLYGAERTRLFGLTTLSGLLLLGWPSGPRGESVPARSYGMVTKSTFEDCSRETPCSCGRFEPIEDDGGNTPFSSTAQRIRV